MTKEETTKHIVSELDAMPEGGDEELLHREADSLIQAALRNLGAPEVADAFERAKVRVGFWYS